MITLRDWYLTSHMTDEVGEEFYMGHGIVSGHPKLADGIDIHTSPIEEVRFDSEAFHTEGLFSPDAVNGKCVLWRDDCDE